MRTIILRCGENAAHAPTGISGEELLLSDVPTRAQLRRLDEVAREVLPEDPTPSLDEIARQPDVSHLTTPGPPPQRPEEALRVIVIGDDAALSAVLTRMMRGDYLWAEVAYVPIAPSSAATNWGLPEELDSAVQLAAHGAVRPVPLIRSDAGLAVAGSASIEDFEDTEITGEIIVDDHVLALCEQGGARPLFGVYGARLVPIVDEPGIAAVAQDTSSSPAAASGLSGKWAKRFDAATVQRLWLSPGTRRLVAGAGVPAAHGAAGTLSTGRAVQAGGRNLKVTVDGVPGKRPVERAAFYRHLRDLQIVRP